VKAPLAASGKRAVARSLARGLYIRPSGETFGFLFITTFLSATRAYLSCLPAPPAWKQDTLWIRGRYLVACSFI
jgi:hypothetical protein